MAPFSILRRSPRGRKGSEEQNSGDDVKTSSGAPVREAHQHDMSPATIGPKDTDDGETTGKGRRGFNKDLLHSIRNRLAAKLPSSAQRGTPQSPQSRSQKQDAAAAVGSPHPVHPVHPVYYTLYTDSHALQSALGIGCNCSMWWHPMPIAKLSDANDLRRTCCAGRRLWGMGMGTLGYTVLCRREPSPAQFVLLKPGVTARSPAAVPSPPGQPRVTTASSPNGPLHQSYDRCRRSCRQLTWLIPSRHPLSCSTPSTMQLYLKAAG